MQGGRDRGPKGRKRGRGPHLSPAATSAGLSTLPTTQPYLAQHLLLKSCQRKTHTQKSGFSPKPLTSSNCSFRSLTTESERKWWEAGPRGSRLGPRRSGTDRSFQRPPTCSRTRPRGLGEHGWAPSAGGWHGGPPGAASNPSPSPGAAALPPRCTRRCHRPRRAWGRLASALPAGEEFVQQTSSVNRVTGDRLHSLREQPSTPAEAHGGPPAGDTLSHPRSLSSASVWLARTGPWGSPPGHCLGENLNHQPGIQPDCPAVTVAVPRAPRPRAGRAGRVGERPGVGVPPWG